MFGYRRSLRTVNGKTFTDHFFIGVVTAAGGLAPVEQAFYQFLLPYFQGEYGSNSGFF